MQSLFNQLKEIDDLLDQISTITSNQTTILIDSNTEESEKITLIENMVTYKDELIDKLQQVEILFDKNYKEKREQVTDKKYITQFKQCVSHILIKKQEIQELEQNNVRIMQSQASKSREQIKIQKGAKEVVSAYKKQQIKD